MQKLLRNKQGKPFPLKFQTNYSASHSDLISAAQFPGLLKLLPVDLRRAGEIQSLHIYRALQGKEPDMPESCLTVLYHNIAERIGTDNQLIPQFQLLLALPTGAQAPCRLVSSKVRTGLLVAGALAYFLFAVSQGFHGVYPYHGIWERALAP